MDQPERPEPETTDDLWDVDPTDGTVAGRGDLPPEELTSFNTVGMLGAAGDIENARRVGRAGLDHVRASTGARRAVPWIAAAILLMVFLVPIVLG